MIPFGIGGIISVYFGNYLKHSDSRIRVFVPSNQGRNAQRTKQEESEKTPQPKICVVAVIVCTAWGAVPPYPRYPAYPPPRYHKPAPYVQHPEPHYDVPAKYAYAYDVNDDYQKLKFDKSESRDGYKTEGSFSVDLPDGRKQIVTYADNGDGLLAEVKYEGDIVVAPYHSPAPAYKPPPPHYPAPHPAYPRKPYFPPYPSHPAYPRYPSYLAPTAPADPEPVEPAIDVRTPEIVETLEEVAALEKEAAPTKAALLVEAAPVVQAVVEAVNVEEAATVDEAAPVEETAPVGEAAPIEETAPVGESAPVEEAAPIEVATPVQEATPVEVAESPDEEAAPVETEDDEELLIEAAMEMEFLAMLLGNWCVPEIIITLSAFTGSKRKNNKNSTSHIALEQPHETLVRDSGL
nr:uncharacterized protein LOC113805538 [Penaeus vannamei]